MDLISLRGEVGSPSRKLSRRVCSLDVYFLLFLLLIDGTAAARYGECQGWS